AVVIELGSLRLTGLKPLRRRREFAGADAGPQLLAYLVNCRVEPADRLIEGPEQQLQDDGRCLKTTLVQLGCAVGEMRPGLFEGRGIAAPDGYDATRRAQDVDLGHVPSRVCVRGEIAPLGRRARR